MELMGPIVSGTTNWNLLATDPLPGQLVNPRVTADEKVEQWLKGRANAQAAGVGLESQRLPGLDLQALRQKYGPQMGERPVYHWATFKVPIAIAYSIVGRAKSDEEIRTQYEDKFRNPAIRKFIDVMDKRGYACTAGTQRWRIRVEPSNYPWPDLMLGGEGNPEYKEFKMLLPFIKKGYTGETVRLELPGHLFEDTEASDGVRSGPSQ